MLRKRLERLLLLDTPQYPGSKYFKINWNVPRWKSKATPGEFLGQYYYYRSWNSYLMNYLLVYLNKVSYYRNNKLLNMYLGQIGRNSQLSLEFGLRNRIKALLDFWKSFHFKNWSGLKISNKNTTHDKLLSLVHWADSPWYLNSEKEKVPQPSKSVLDWTWSYLIIFSLPLLLDNQESVGIFSSCRSTCFQVIYNHDDQLN